MSSPLLSVLIVENGLLEKNIERNHFYLKKKKNPVVTQLYTVLHKRISELHRARLGDLVHKDGTH